MSDILLDFDPEDSEKWIIWKSESKRLIKHGLETGKILFYDQEFLKQLRGIYSEGIPASITLLCNYLTNGKCIESAFLLSRVFLDDDNTKDVNLVQAKVDSIRLNPVFKQKKGKDNDDYSKHAVVERILNDGKVLIYDTTAGYAIDYDLWEKIENPTDFDVKGKKWITDVVEKETKVCPEYFSPNPMAAAIVIPEIESHYDDPEESFARECGWLQNEVELFKKEIGYDDFCKKNEQAIKTLRLKTKKQMEEEEND